MSQEDTASGAEKSGKDDASTKQSKSNDPRTAQSKSEDAVTALKNDHRKVEDLFQKYQQSNKRNEKQKLARQICQELIVHTKLEEELFYPACREADVEDDMLDEAQVEHDGAKVLINELLSGTPQEQYYDAKVKVLSEEIKHHVNEEEKRDGIFAKAKASGIDLDALGQKLAARKAELLQEVEQNGLERPRPRSFTQRGTENTMPQGQYRDRDDRGRFMSDDDDDRRYGSRGSSGRDRDEYGRFTSDDDDDRRSYSSRSGGGRYEDDDRRGRHGGWFGDSEGHSRAARQRGGGSQYSRDYDDDRRSYSSSRSGGNGGQYRDRDEYGRFTSDDDDRRSYSSRSYGGSSRYQDEGEGRGWYGDPEGHSEASRRGWEHRQGSGRGMSAGGNGGRRMRDDDDDRSSRSRSRSGHGGWFGDSEGHSEASRRGWENR